MMYNFHLLAKNSSFNIFTVIYKELILILSFVCCGLLSSAQGISINGQVIDAKNRIGIENVLIQLKADSNYRLTNTLGEFSVYTKGEYPQTLIISALGYETQEMLIRSNEKITIELYEKVNELKEVVIVSGYNTQKKEDFSGAVSNISSKQLLVRPAVSFDQLLGGLASGMDVIQSTSVLNNTPVVRIRGLNSITSGLFPLVVVDGVSVFTGAIGGSIGNNPLSDINPNDIESIDVLKDASAAAIFGSRAANGVIVITTKKGKRGRVQCNYNTNVSISTPYNLPKLLNAEDYVLIKNEAMVNSGRAPGYALLKDKNGNVVNTNWYDVAYRPGISQAHNLSFSGANNSTKYFFSLSYDDQSNFIRNNTFKKYSTRLNIENQIYKFITVGAYIAYNNSRNIGPITGAIPSNTLASSAYNSQYITNEPLGRMTYVLPPNVPVYNEDGSYSIQNKVSVGYGANNPATIGTINAYNLALVQKYDITHSDNNTIIGNAYADLTFTKNLKWRTSYGVYNLLNTNTEIGNPIHGGGASSNGIATNIFANYKRYDLVNTLIYKLNVHRNHHAEILLGNERIKSQIESWGAQRSNITDPFYTNYQGGYINISPIGNVSSDNALLSYFSNINYDYLKKYYISFNVRRDGLSALADGHKYGNFAGGSAAWNISNESFYLRPFKNILDNVKLRASYGLVGNSDIGDYPSVGAFTSSTYGGNPTLNYAQTANPDLKWEVSKKFDAGINFTILKERLGIEIDYYKNNISDLILKAPQALSSGIPGNYINANVGSMYNKGFEFNVNGKIIDKTKLKWNLNLNLATLENKVTSLVSDVYVPSIFGVQNMTRVGYSIGSIFAVPAIGVNPENGLMMFKNSEGKIVQYNHIGSPRWTYLDGTPADAIDNYKDGVIIGSSLPKVFGGLNSNLRYQNFELAVNLTFAAGNYLYNGTRATNSDQRYFNNGEFIKDRWTAAGQHTEIAKLQYGDNVSSGFSFSATSKVEKGDYVKLKNISLAYLFPLKSEYLRKNITAAKFYVQAVNLYTLTKYRGSDPEISINGNSIHSGKDQNSPPNAQIFAAGFNITF